MVAAVSQATLARPLAHLERLARAVRGPDELIARVGVWMSEETGADAHVFVRLDPLSALWTSASGDGHLDGSCDAFTERAFLRSPYADYASLARASERVIILSPGDADDGDPYARLCFDEFGFAQELLISLSAQGQAFGHLTLSRRGGPFGEEALRLVHAIVGPLTAHLRRLHARETVESTPGERIGLVFVDASGGLRAGNATGDELLAAHAARPEPRPASTLQVLAELIRRDVEAPSSAPLPTVLFIDAARHRRYRLTCERLRGEGPCALIMAEPLRALDSVDLLRTAGLSDREADVALLTLRGLRSAEGAAALGLAESTVLSHLKAVYRKLGVGSRGELASLLLGGL